MRHDANDGFMQIYFRYISHIVRKCPCKGPIYFKLGDFNAKVIIFISSDLVLSPMYASLDMG